MDEDSFFRSATVSIIGLGLMGGSLALALKGICGQLYGYDLDDSVLQQASKTGIFHLLTDDRKQVVENVDCIILAAPVSAIIEWLDVLPTLCHHKVILLDFGSTKKLITQSMNRLPVNFEAIGGHPMCGKEKSGFQFADGNLFEGATFALVKTQNTTHRSILVIDELVRMLRCKPLWIDADTHDRWTAYSSHFPYIAANQIAAIIPPEASPLVSSGFRSTTRLASSSRRMMIDIILSNRENVLSVLKEYMRQLAAIENALEQNNCEELENILNRGYSRHQKIILS